MEYKNITLQKLNHAAFKIKNNKVIYLDSFKIPEGAEKADLILISHEHFDHCSPDDLKKLVSPQTTLITIPLCKDKLSGLAVKEIRYVKPGDSLEAQGVKVEVVPAYNINKFRSPGIPFHPPADNKVGFVIEVDGVRIYHAGDTDNIPEMQNLKNIDLALLPVSGTYVMTAEEAAEAVKIIKPQIAIPMHYGNIVGTEEDAKKFKEMSLVPVKII